LRKSKYPCNPNHSLLENILRKVQLTCGANVLLSLKANQTKYATQVQAVSDLHCTWFGGFNDMFDICGFNNGVRFLMFEKGNRNPCCT